MMKATAVSSNNEISPSSPRHHDSNHQNKGVSLEWAFLPKPTLPPREEFQPVEKFVSDAILSRHDENDVDVEESNNNSSNSTSNSSSNNGAIGYRAILDLLRKKDDIPMLRKVFLALTSTRTNAIEKIASERSRHNRLIHLIFRINPFVFTNLNSLMQQEDQQQQQRQQQDQLDYSLGETYLNFIVALTSANSVFLTPTLNSIWRLIINTDAITPYDKQLYLSTTSTTDTTLNQLIVQHQLKVNSLLHGTLKKVLDLVPKGKSEIYSVIASSFPFKLSPLSTQVNYMKQSLIVLRYVPSMERRFLELCIDKCLEIDVEIQIADNGDVKIEEQKKDDDDDDDHHRDLDSTNNNNNSMGIFIQSPMKITSQQQTPQTPSQTEEEKVDEMAEKLDTLMYLIFDHLQALITSRQKSPRQCFQMIMSTFESVILTTHRCKFVQFIIVYLCGIDVLDEIRNDEEKIPSSPSTPHKDIIHQELNTVNDDDYEGEGDNNNNDKNFQPQLCRQFAAKLIDIVLDPYRATVTRQSAACYLASFVSRASCVCAETACEAISALLRFAKAYMETFPTEASSRNARRFLGTDSNGDQQADRVAIHSLYYTICQAAFYIMCFRGKECIQYYQNAVQYHSNLDHDNNADHEYLEYSDPQLIDITSVKWNEICSHHLNPLKFCLESVRGEFLHLADKFDLLDENLLDKLIIEDQKLSSSISSSNLAAMSSTLTVGDRRRVMSRKRRKASCIQTAATMEKRRIVGGVGGLGKGSNPLDSFFPFDPYLLRRSYNFVEPHYRHWTGIDDVNNDESNDEDVSKSIEKERDGMKHSNDLNLHSDNESDDDEIDSHDDDDEEGSDDNDDDHNDDEKDDNVNDLLIKGKEASAMSLTSATATVSMGGSEWTDDLTDDNDINSVDQAMEPGRTAWVNELKRGRGLSMGDDCW